jgi:hypothetical protein
MSVKTIYEIRKLWEIVSEIGHIAEASEDNRLVRLYQKLSYVLDYVEDSGLIEYEEEK